MKKNILVVTGSRAEFGLLNILLKKIRKDENMELTLVVTGMHLSTEFNSSFGEIEEAGFEVYRKIESLLASDSPQGISKSIGLGFIGFADLFEEFIPDLMIVLGDRFEILPAVISASIAGITIAHIHGGEITEGAFDDPIRHSITKFSKFHFTATETYRKRVIQLGEEPERVFNVGALGLDNIKKYIPLSKESLNNELGIPFDRNVLLVTYHPETFGISAKEGFRELLLALDNLDDVFIVFTNANADTGGREVNRMIEKFVSENLSKAVCFESLGVRKYLSLMSCSSAVVGNSSSGIIEAPSFGVGTVNIGKRQLGRIKADSVVDVEPEANSILSGIKLVLSKDFRNRISNIQNPYGDGNTAETMIVLIRGILEDKCEEKVFYDLDS